MASAAYWIGSAADAVYISGDTSQVGSIGVVAAHMDISKAEEMIGVKTTEITAGKYKRIASRHAPLSQEGRQTMQEMVDYVYSAFVGDVAKHRGVSEEQVLEQMADGRIFFGRQAVNAGLVDGVSTMEELIGKLSAGELVGKPAATGVVAAVIADIKEEPMKVKAGEQVIEVQDTLEIDAKWIAKNCPDIANALRGEGAQAERERIQGIEEHVLPGYETIVAEAKKDGKSTGADVAMRIVKAENQVRTKKLEEIRERPRSRSRRWPWTVFFRRRRKRRRPSRHWWRSIRPRRDAPVERRSARWPRRIPKHTRSSSHGSRQDQAVE